MGTLGYVIPQDWKLDAECARLDKDGKSLYDPDMWFVERRPQGREARRLGVLTNRQSITRAMEICNTLCPVRAECRESATYEDRRVSVRGGIAPQSNAPAPMTRDPMIECKRGHNLRLPNARTTAGQCRLCKQYRERIDYVPDVVKSKDDTTDSTA